MSDLPSTYYIVIFRYKWSPHQTGYVEMSKRLNELVQKEEGFIKVTDYTNNEEGVSISYWKSKEAIDQWKRNSVHQEAIQLASERWYESFSVEVAKVG